MTRLAYWTGTLRVDGCHDDEEEDNQLDEEHDQTATGKVVQTAHGLLTECLGQTGDNTQHDDQRHAITDALVRDALTKPQDEHTAGGKDDGGSNHERGPSNCRIQGAARLHLEVLQICGSLEQKDEDGQVAGVLVDLTASALALALHLLEIGDGNGKDLDDDGCRDVRHDTKCEDGRIGECTSREHVQKAHQTFAGLLAQCCQLVRVNAWKHHE